MQQSKTDSGTNKIIAGLDIGTSKVCAIVAAADDNNNGLKILGMGITESDGLNRGVVVNIEKTVKSIKKVIEQAEQQSGFAIDELFVGIAGDHIDSFQTKGIVGISNPDQEITESDVQRVIDESRNIAVPAERKIIHVIPQEFIIDGQDGITDPVGMSGVRLEVNVHVVTGLVTAINNINKCVERIGRKVKEVVLEPLASSYAVLDDEEKEVGVALVDIGGGTTDIAIFEENIIRFTSVFAIAGKQVTDDIRRGLGVVVEQAERVKRDYGHTFLDSIMKDDLFMIPSPGGRKPMEISKKELCRIIQPRMEEIFEFALAEIKRSGFIGSLGAGIVITGGSSLVRGVEELGRTIFNMPVKIGMPSKITYSGLAPEIENPMYSTSVGLVQYGLRHIDYSSQKSASKQKKNVETEQKEKGKKKSSSVFSKMKKFIEDL